MIDNFNIMFNEVYSVLNLLGREYIYKLPNNVYEFIKNERVPNYEFNINMERDVISQISKDALAFISYLNLKYWATLEEQRELIKIYKENDIKKEKSKLKFNPRTILNNNTKEIESKALIKEEQNWYKKLKNIILNFFKNIKDKKNN
ncbi:MAG: hypothetical protein ACLTTR_02180 [Clostridia bacterium]|jgi:hypothetical protein|uniref:hypothetical protein n=1 Tax=Candidatus Merdicola sp. TaxID=3085652 RepID=UPI00095DC696|nr:MAG: hypothetical protein BHV96_03125 [Clostridium sp. CAG:354_28_25]